MNKLIYFSIIAANSIIMAAEPMVPSSMSTDRGGIKPAIDAYSDGGGVLLYTDHLNDSLINNSAMNELVFKYGEAAKTDSVTLQNEVKTLAPSTVEEKVLADQLSAVASPIGTSDIKTGSCSDGDAQTIDDKYVSGVCVGTNVEGKTCDDYNVQTINDVYHNGVCAGTNVEGQACNDNNSKTISDIYINGVCKGLNASNVYFLGVNGNNSNDCSYDSPCLNLTNIPAGATVVIKNGTYNTITYWNGYYAPPSPLYGLKANMKIYGEDRDNVLLSDYKHPSSRDMPIIRNFDNVWLSNVTINFNSGSLTANYVVAFTGDGAESTVFNNVKFNITGYYSYAYNNTGGSVSYYKNCEFVGGTRTSNYIAGSSVTATSAVPMDNFKTVLNLQY